MSRRDARHGNQRQVRPGPGVLFALKVGAAEAVSTSVEARADGGH